MTSFFKKSSKGLFSPFHVTSPSSMNAKLINPDTKHAYALKLRHIFQRSQRFNMTACSSQNHTGMETSVKSRFHMDPDHADTH